MEDNQQNQKNTAATTSTANSSPTTPTGIPNPVSVSTNIPSTTNENVINDPSSSPLQNATNAVADIAQKGTTNDALASIANISENTKTTDNKDILTQIAENIIKEQESIIGPVALEQASKVEGLKIDLKTNTIVFQGDKRQILENLVKQYEQLFGRISVEICKEAVRNIISQAPTDQVPQILL